jgi:hypothetical protein
MFSNVSLSTLEPMATLSTHASGSSFVTATTPPGGRVVALSFLPLVPLLPWAISAVAFYSIGKYMIRSFKRHIRRTCTPQLIAEKAILDPFDFEGFATCINLPNYVEASSIKCDKSAGALEVMYKIPRSVCTKSEIDGRYRMGLGAIIALADQFTSIMVIAVDDTHRVGVSISLSGELLVDNDQDDVCLEEGRSIRLVAVAEKLGATLGFLTMAVYAADSEARMLSMVRHIKYLKMGPV